MWLQAEENVDIDLQQEKNNLTLFKHILLSSILVNNRVIVIENWQKNFQLQLQQNCVINYNFVNYNYNFSKPDGQRMIKCKLCCQSSLDDILHLTLFSYHSVQ